MVMDMSSSIVPALLNSNSGLLNIVCFPANLTNEFQSLDQAVKKGTLWRCGLTRWGAAIAQGIALGSRIKRSKQPVRLQ